VLFLGILAGVLGGAGCERVPGARTRGAAAPQDSPRPDDPTPARVAEAHANRGDATWLIQEWGIEPLGINLSAAGYLLDFRYRVIDPEKALGFTDRSVKPYLIDQATGAKMYVPSPPKVGRLQQTSRKPVAGRVHFVLFANPGRFVKPGAKVTVVFGDCQIKDLTVAGLTPPSSAAASSTGQDVDQTP